MDSLDQLRADIAELLTHCWEDELQDFAENCMSDEGTHTFRTLVRLDNFLNGSSKRAIDYVEDS